MRVYGGLQKGVLWLCLCQCVACVAPLANIPSDYRFMRDTGVIVLSLTATGECGFAYFTDIRDMYADASYSIGMQDSGRERDWRKQGTDCPSGPHDFFGKLVVIELPAGTYQMTSFVGMRADKQVCSKQDMRIDFTVVPGKINYLGNIHFHVNKTNFIYGGADERQRDISLFQKKYPQFRQTDIIMNLLRIKTLRNIAA